MWRQESACTGYMQPLVEIRSGYSPFIYLSAGISLSWVVIPGSENPFPVMVNLDNLYREEVLFR